MGEQCTVYVSLLNDGAIVWRPVTAEKLGPDLFRLQGPKPDYETWQFQPGQVVRCELRVLSGGPALVAVEDRPGG
jgi:hypothetical protein